MQHCRSALTCRRDDQRDLYIPPELLLIPSIINIVAVNIQDMGIKIGILAWKRGWTPGVAIPSLSAGPADDASK